MIFTSYWFTWNLMLVVYLCPDTFKYDYYFLNFLNEWPNLLFNLFFNLYDFFTDLRMFFNLNLVIYFVTFEVYFLNFWIIYIVFFEIWYFFFNVLLKYFIVFDVLFFLYFLIKVNRLTNNYLFNFFFYESHLNNVLNFLNYL